VSGLSTVQDLRRGDAIRVVRDRGETVIGRFEHVVYRGKVATIFFTETLDDPTLDTWDVDATALIETASGWDEPARESEATRTLLRGLPFGAAIAVLAIVGWVVHPAGFGGIGFLIVVLWLVGVVRMVTTPRGDR
jgi:hypothetical protein